MDALVGVWVLSGDDAQRAVPVVLREALLYAGVGAARETLEGPLWLAALPDAVAREGSRLLALIGLLAGPAGDCSAQSLLARWEGDLPSALPPGHYAAVHADLSRRTLSLYRDAFGMARLYHAESGGLLLFSTHAKALLAAGVAGGMDREAALEAVLSADLGVIFGDRTLLAGVCELEPGTALIVSPGRRRTRAVANPFIETWRPGPAPSSRELRGEFVSAVERAIGPEARVAVALSGGIDSALIAALAVNSLGAKKVEAFTYEFDDPAHPSETAYAASVCRRLGIIHHVVRLGEDACAASVPELFWRLETPRLISAPWLPLARALAERGLRRVLTGDGMELTLGFAPYFEETSALARALRRLPLPGLLLRPWRPMRFSGALLRAWAQRLMPALAPPPDSAYHMVLCVLRHNGLIEDAGTFYPVGLRELARAAAESERVREAVERRRALPLAEQFRFHRLNAYALHRHFRGKPMAWSELGGALPSCPALLLSGAPLPRPERWKNDRSLLQAALGSLAPDEIWSRPKIEGQAVLPADWVARICSRLAPLAPEAAVRLGLAPAARADLLRYYGRELSLLGLWARIFDAGPVSERTPSFESLGL